MQEKWKQKASVLTDTLKEQFGYDISNEKELNDLLASGAIRNRKGDIIKPQSSYDETLEEMAKRIDKGSIYVYKKGQKYPNEISMNKGGTISVGDPLKKDDKPKAPELPKVKGPFSFMNWAFHFWLRYVFRQDDEYNRYRYRKNAYEKLTDKKFLKEREKQVNREKYLEKQAAEKKKEKEKEKSKEVEIKKSEPQKAAEKEVRKAAEKEVQKEIRRSEPQKETDDIQKQLDDIDKTMEELQKKKAVLLKQREALQLQPKAPQPEAVQQKKELNLDPTKLTLEKEGPKPEKSAPQEKKPAQEDPVARNREAVAMFFGKAHAGNKEPWETPEYRSVMSCSNEQFAKLTEQSEVAEFLRVVRQPGREVDLANPPKDVQEAVEAMDSVVGLKLQEIREDRKKEIRDDYYAQTAEGKDVPKPGMVRRSERQELKSMLEKSNDSSLSGMEKLNIASYVNKGLTDEQFDALATQPAVKSFLEARQRGETPPVEKEREVLALLGGEKEKALNWSPEARENAAKIAKQELVEETYQRYQRSLERDPDAKMPDAVKEWQREEVARFFGAGAANGADPRETREYRQIMTCPEEQFNKLAETKEVRNFLDKRMEFLYENEKTAPKELKEASAAMNGVLGQQLQTLKHERREQLRNEYYAQVDQKKDVPKPGMVRMRERAAVAMAMNLYGRDRVKDSKTAAEYLYGGMGDGGFDKLAKKSSIRNYLDVCRKYGFPNRNDTKSSPEVQAAAKAMMKDLAKSVGPAAQQWEKNGKPYDSKNYQAHDAAEKYGEYQQRVKNGEKLPEPKGYKEWQRDRLALFYGYAAADGKDPRSTQEYEAVRKCDDQALQNLLKQDEVKNFLEVCADYVYEDEKTAPKELLDAAKTLRTGADKVFKAEVREAKDREDRAKAWKEWEAKAPERQKQREEEERRAEKERAESQKQFQQKMKKLDEEEAKKTEAQKLVEGTHLEKQMSAKEIEATFGEMAKSGKDLGQMLEQAEVKAPKQEGLVLGSGEALTMKNKEQTEPKKEEEPLELRPKEAPKKEEKTEEEKNAEVKSAETQVRQEEKQPEVKQEEKQPEVKPEEKEVRQEEKTEVKTEEKAREEKKKDTGFNIDTDAKAESLEAKKDLKELGKTDDQQIEKDPVGALLQTLQEQHKDQPIPENVTKNIRELYENCESGKQKLEEQCSLGGQFKAGTEVRDIMAFEDIRQRIQRGDDKVMTILASKDGVAYQQQLAGTSRDMVYAAKNGHQPGYYQKTFLDPVGLKGLYDKHHASAEQFLQTHSLQDKEPGIAATMMEKLSFGMDHPELAKAGLTQVTVKTPSLDAKTREI